ncbi:MAG: hypothetical protein HZB26_26385 [Candidatus Hydrogenedentes bacterium]|nr:hypothetical protein [Candidatus Hydrogenedentota bacterium]
MSSILGDVARRRLLALAALVCLAGCWGEPPSPSYANPFEVRQRYLDQASKFAQSLINGTYQSTYNLASSQLKARQGFQEFNQTHRDAAAQYGKPERFEVTLDATDLEAIKKDPLGIPGGVPEDKCRAWVTIVFKTNPDATGKDRVLYTCRALLVEDKGKERVAFYKYAPAATP